MVGVGTSFWYRPVELSSRSSNGDGDDIHCVLSISPRLQPLVISTQNVAEITGTAMGFGISFLLPVCRW